MIVAAIVVAASLAPFASGDGVDGGFNNSSNASGACSSETLPGTLAEISSTPRLNQDAERLALRRTEAIVALDAEYETIASHLVAIRQTSEFARQVHVKATDDSGASSILVKLEETALEAAKDGKYTGLNCTNDWYEMRMETVFSRVPWIMISSAEGKLYNARRICEAYQAHPDVEQCNADSLIGGSSDITLTVHDEVYRYSFKQGQGDCPAGCIEWIIHSFDVNVEGNVTFVPFVSSPDGTMSTVTSALSADAADMPASHVWLPFLLAAIASATSTIGVTAECQQ